MSEPGDELRAEIAVEVAGSDRQPDYMVEVLCSVCGERASARELRST